MIFLLLFVAICLVYNYYKILPLRPRSIHQWRQTDCLSIALNYYYEGMNFFKPHTHWLGNTGTGKLVGEFPIIYYLVAILWKIFGYHEIIFRSVDIAIVFTGLWMFRKMLFNFLEDSFWATSISLFVFTSPVLVFYTNNFLPDAPSFGLTLAGWYLFGKYYMASRQKYLWWAMIFFLFAGLLKVSSMISWVSLGLIFMFDLFRKGKVFLTYKIQTLIALGVVLVAVAAWYLFANNYCSELYFSMHTYPIWALSGEKIQQVFYFFNEDMGPFIMNGSAVAVLIIMYLYILFNRKNADSVLFAITQLLVLGGMCYSLLWFEAFQVHDYYFIVLLIIPAFILLTFFHTLKKNAADLFHSRFLKVSFALLLVWNIYYCAEKYKIRYLSYGSYAIAIREKNYWDWFHSDYKSHYEAFETITPYIRELGIKREDRVISMPDQSPNISLYLMDQKGWTTFDYCPIINAEGMQTKIAMGAKYLFVSRPEIYNLDYMQPYLKKKIGEYKNVTIFDLRDLH